MASLILKISAVLFVIGFCAAQSGDRPVTELCLRCLCEAYSGCNLGTGCDGETCGPFKITWGYWFDAGKPTPNGESPDSPQAYPYCTTDPNCAAQAIQNYMSKFGRDCDGDGQINCYDFMAIHRLGPFACSGNVPAQFANRFNQCIAVTAANNNNNNKNQ